MIDAYTQVPDAKALRQSWQTQAWVYYDLVPEVRFAATLFGNALARIILFAASVPDDASASPVKITEGPLADAVRNLKDETGTQRSFLRELAVNLFVEGEAYLLGEDGNNWLILSNDEVTFNGQGNNGKPIASYRTAPFESLRPVSDGSLLMRIWKSHPRWSRLADSAMRTVQDDCEKLILLSKAEKASIRSRFASSGLLFIPQELVPPAWQNQDKTANPMDSNPLWRAIADSMMAASKDEGHPANLVPILLTGPAAHGSAIKYITLDRPLDKLAQDLRESAIRRIAVAFDLPTDYLLGLGDVNHWTAWAIKEDAFSAHFQPFIELICDSLTTGYLHPIMRQNGISEEIIASTIIWYDPKNLLVRPDKTEVAIQAYDRGAISQEELRKTLGFPEEAAMSEEEHAKWIGITLADPKMALTGKPTEPPAPAAPSGGGSGGAGGRAKGSLVSHQPKGSSVTGPKAEYSRSKASRQKTAGPATSDNRTGTLTAAGAPDLSRQLGLMDIDLMNKVRVLTEEAVKRAAEKMGARVRSRVAADKAVTASINGMKNADVPAFFGYEAIQNFGYDTDSILGKDLEEAALRAADLAEETVVSALDLVANHTGSEVATYAFLDGSIKEAKSQAAGAFKKAMIDILRETVFSDPRLRMKDGGEIDSVPVAPVSLRRPISVSGGGSVYADVSKNLSGAATGKFVQEYMTTVGLGQDGYLWIYSPYIKRPRGPFNPHLQLDGLHFQTWQDPELEIPDEKTGRFLRINHMHPGDHWGCMCVVVPWTGENLGPPRAISPE